MRFSYAPIAAFVDHYNNRRYHESLGKPKRSRATYTCVLTDNGGVVDDSVVFCTADDEFLYVIGTGNSGEVIENIAKVKDVELEWDNSLQLMSVQGPNSSGQGSSPSPSKLGRAGNLPTKR